VSDFITKGDVSIPTMGRVVAERVGEIMTMSKGNRVVVVGKLEEGVNEGYFAIKCVILGAFMEVTLVWISKDDDVSCCGVKDEEGVEVAWWQLRRFFNDKYLLAKLIEHGLKGLEEEIVLWLEIVFPGLSKGFPGEDGGEEV